MTIRHATESDLPQIVGLMKSSLGESLIPKSEPLWVWKHEKNPFGRSFVLVAEEDGRLIGLRAFMQWKWNWKSKEYRAIRAVDTATHPSHQGKGIFKKLTLQLLEECKNDGIDFVFNTPNGQSRPGYLKMGWEQQGRMPMKIKLTNVFKIAARKLFYKTDPDAPYHDPTPAANWQKPLDLLADAKIMTTPSLLETPFSKEYVQWRYADNPLFNYTYFSDYTNYVATGRIKLQGKLRELRITDYFKMSESSAHDLAKQIKNFCSEHHIHFISLSGNQFLQLKKDFRWMGMLPVKNIGPIVTLRNLNMNERFPALLQTDNWNYSVGDMELF